MNKKEKIKSLFSDVNRSLDLLRVIRSDFQYNENDLFDIVGINSDIVDDLLSIENKIEDIILKIESMIFGGKKQ